jgi:hypothetical protein
MKTVFRANQMPITHIFERKEGTVKKQLDLLKGNTPEEKDQIAQGIASLISVLGEKGTSKLLSELGRAGVKLVDYLNTLSSRGPGLPMPRMRYDQQSKPNFRHLEASSEPTEEYPGESLIDLEMVKDYLTGRYGREMAEKKLDRMTRGQMLDLYLGLKDGKDVSAIADVIHVQQTSTPNPPRMVWCTDSQGRTVPEYSHLDGPEVDHVNTVLDHLTTKHGETKAKAKIRAMSGLELVKMSDKLRRNQEATVTETGRALRAFNIPPENHLANAVLAGELSLPLDEKEERLIDDQLPEAEEAARELEASFEERIRRQAPRHWTKLRNEPPSGLIDARQFVDSLKNEIQVLRTTLTESARISEERRVEWNRHLASTRLRAWC